MKSYDMYFTEKYADDDAIKDYLNKRLLQHISILCNPYIYDCLHIEIITQYKLIFVPVHVILIKYHGK